jgi:hypothetical protein
LTLGVLKLAVLVSGVWALAKLGLLNFITGRFDTGYFGVRPKLFSKRSELKSFQNKINKMLKLSGH